ncbi:MAG TPA: hypothetical protein GXZ29_02135 [Clostridiales bacterium]|nr:hypothetical protein [Clostridiales bacterium]
MTPKQRFIAALERQPVAGHVPHFELVFYLTMESIGKVHPTHRVFHQWDQMSQKEKALQRRDAAQTYIDIADKYQHDAIFVHSFVPGADEMILLLESIREISGDRYFLMMHGDPTFSIPGGNNMIEESVLFYEQPELMKSRAQKQVDEMLQYVETIAKTGLLDGVGMCSDYCFNTNPFLRPSMFAEFVTPYLAKTIEAYRSMGLYSIKHTDGNIMPIIDQLVQCKPDALHSLDPQGGVDLAYVKKTYGDQVCLIGNVNCALLQNGTEEEMSADVLRSLRDGMSGGYGYIFSTSNCIYTGLALSRYETMHKLWREHGIYPEDK